MIFETVLFNKENGYKNNSGHFEAPVSGLYSFSAQICTVERNDFRMAFGIWRESVSNFVTVVRTEYIVSSTCFTIVSLCELSVKEHIYVLIFVPGIPIPNDYISEWSYFSGVLLREQ